LDRRKEAGEFIPSVSTKEATSNYQRKILPWEKLDDTMTKQAYKQKKRHEIIMVASLIDKIPNLAGLSRSSEIFNVTALVVPSKDIVYVNHTLKCVD
jgi:tRNA guanosine-2'-O-methyltransferase